MWIFVNFPFICAHLHLQASLHIEKEVQKGMIQSSPKTPYWTACRRAQHFVSVHPQAPSPVTMTFCPSCKTTEAIWELSCLPPSECRIKDNFFTAPRQRSLNPQRSDWTRAGQNISLCSHSTQPVSSDGWKKLTPSKTTALGPKRFFFKFWDQTKIHNQCHSGLKSCAMVNMVDERAFGPYFT